MVAPHQAELRERLEDLARRTRQGLLQTWERGRQRLDGLAAHWCFRLPLEGIRDRERRLDELEGRIHRAMKQHLLQLRERLRAQTGRLEGLSPLNVFARGYSLTRREKDLAVIRLGT